MPQTVIEGVYAISFDGFNREARGTRARVIAGVGQLTLKKTSDTGGTASALHRATNMPMTGQQDEKYRDNNLRHATYRSSGNYIVRDAGATGNPIYFEITLDFVEEGGPGTLKDTFVAMQCGPGRFRLLSTGPEGPSGPVDEMVFGEAIKVASDW